MGGIAQMSVTSAPVWWQEQRRAWMVRCNCMPWLISEGANVSERRSRIVVIGSSNIDFIMKMPRLPGVGESITEAVFMQTFGGKGANQATAAARAGGEVWFVNCVGDDELTNRMIEGFQRDRIHTDFVFKQKSCLSGTALVMIGENGENYLAVAPGANNLLDRSHIDPVMNLLSESCVAMFQNEIKPETLLYGLKRAKRSGATVLLNFAPVRPLPTDPLKSVDILVVNRTEAEQLSGKTILDNGKAAAEMLLSRGPKMVIITLGADGAWVSTLKFKRRIGVFSVGVVDTTAAGDTFCGALSVALTESKALEQALRFASAAAALSVTKMGAQPSIPTRLEIDAFLENHTEEL
jgi:ribokinase